jgi:phospholipase D1/2
VLKKKHRGVHIFVMVYHELEAAVELGSRRAAKRLRELHENIRVIRHPQRLNRESLVFNQSRIFMWSNHEKSVIVDQSIAFIGGIDLCYGRWDTREHWYEDVKFPVCSPKIVT